jgi:hypothetical protein
MLTIRPLVARSCARKAWVTLNTPLRLTAMMSCQSLITASGSAVKALRRLMPALLTRIETWPIVAPICAATSRHLSRSVTSSLKLKALPPAPVMALTVAAAVSPSASRTATCAPSLA